VIYSALLVPHENPNSLREIKRALLTYEKVVLVDPDDRDLIPANSFMSTIMGIPLIGINTGPVRPMGKALGYDDRFERTLDYCSQAVEQGLLEVRSTYQKEAEGQMTIGAVPLGGYPLRPQFVFWSYRAMASDSQFLRSSIEGDAKNLRTQLDFHPEIAEQGGGDGGINDIPALPIHANNELLTKVARARIGAFIKYAGYCEAKDLVPVFTSDIYGGIASTLLNNAASTLATADEHGELLRAGRVMELCHEEFIDDSLLDRLEISEVIKLRTSSWGKQAQAREKLFTSIFQIAQEVSSNNLFEDSARRLISNYKSESEDLLNEREKLGFQLKCDIASSTLAGGLGLVGLLSQLESPLQSIGATLAAGGIWALGKSKEYVPALREIKSQEEKMKKGAAFGLHNFYSRIKKAS